MEKAELVFIPAPALGHLIPTVEFAKCLIQRDDRFSVTIRVMEFLWWLSWGVLVNNKVKEIAFGLEQSGIRFLWSLRKPPPKDKIAEPNEYTSGAQEVLPKGFLENTKEIGLVWDGRHKSRYWVWGRVGLDFRNTGGEVVLRDEIARAIKSVMDGENEVRKRVKEKSEQSRLAVREGGSSFAAYGGLIDEILRNKP
ncbi:UDP-glycosyltransferase 71A16-like [Pistacia vera]|uniref:UDP-glycosyltransferase 71A16-like n=1 Tax=Pistacia vera TaxID=55513 RepID=UPI001263B502|nr:UDP-glycosyltransferase 71A16-like [Pistacia vera]